MQLRQHGAQLHFFVPGGQLCPAFCRTVAVGPVGWLVPRHGPGNAAILAEGYRALLRVHPQRVEVIVQGVHIPAALVVPAAGLVHKAGIVQRADGLHRSGGIKLPPPLVKGYPAAHAGVAPQRLYGGFQFLAVFFPAGLLFAAQQPP